MSYFPGYGTQLKIGSASGSSLPAPGSDTLTAVTLFSNLKLPDNIRTKSTFKTLDSNSPRSIGGSLEEQVITFRLVFDPDNTQHALLRADAIASGYVRRNYQIILPNSGAYKFDQVAWLSKWTWEELENDKEGAAQIELTVDGPVVETT